MCIKPEKFMLLKPTKKELEIYENTDFQDKIVAEINSDFHNISIVKNKIGKFIMFKDTYQAGLLDMKGYKGNIPYINYFLLPLFFRKNIKNILLIGMGTGKLVNDFEKLLEDNLKSIDVVDIDPNIFDIAEQHFGFIKSAKINLHLQDGRIFLRNGKKKYDLIIVDVAGNDGIPKRYITQEFFEEAKSKLKKDGVLVSNLFSSSQYNSPKNLILKRFMKTFRSVFNNIKLFKSNFSDKLFYKTFFDYDKRIIDLTNAIFFASNEPLQLNLSQPLIKKFEKIGIKNAEKYLEDIYEEAISTNFAHPFKD